MWNVIIVINQSNYGKREIKEEVDKELSMEIWRDIEKDREILKW